MEIEDFIISARVVDKECNPVEGIALQLSLGYPLGASTKITDKEGWVHYGVNNSFSRACFFLEDDFVGLLSTKKGSVHTIVKGTKLKYPPDWGCSKPPFPDRD